MTGAGSWCVWVLHMKLILHPSTSSTTSVRADASYERDELYVITNYETNTHLPIQQGDSAMQCQLQ